MTEIIEETGEQVRSRIEARDKKYAVIDYEVYQLNYQNSKPADFVKVGEFDRKDLFDDGCQKTFDEFFGVDVLGEDVE